MYATPNWRSTNHRICIDVQSPAHQRAPHEHPSSYATECAYDELASALGMDPVAFRLLNDADRDPITGKPFSARKLAECLRRGSDRFGWDRRKPEPGLMRSKDGQLVGFGAAVASRLAADGLAVVVNYASGATPAEELVAQIESRVGRAIAVRADVSDPHGLASRLYDERDRGAELEAPARCPSAGALSQR